MAEYFLYDVRKQDKVLNVMSYVSVPKVLVHFLDKYVNHTNISIFYLKVLAKHFSELVHGKPYERRFEFWS